MVTFVVDHLPGPDLLAIQHQVPFFVIPRVHLHVGHLYFYPVMSRQREVFGQSGSGTEVVETSVHGDTGTSGTCVSSVSERPAFSAHISQLGPTPFEEFPVLAVIGFSTGASVALLGASFNQQLEVSNSPGFILSMLVKSGGEDNVNSRVGVLDLDVDVHSLFLPIASSTTQLFSLVILERLIENSLVVGVHVEMLIIPGVDFP